MKRTVFVVLLAMALVVGISYITHAEGSYLTNFNNKYGTSGTRLDSCSLCHTSPPALNSYGADYKKNGRDCSAIEALDSDGDKFSNLAEIKARTFPGNASSKPAPAKDKTKPTVTAFEVSPTCSSLTVPITSFTATDNVKVTGYMLTTKPKAPLASSLKWKAKPPAKRKFPTAGIKTLYAWAKDKKGNISLPLSATVTITLTTGAQNVPAQASVQSNTAAQSSTGQPIPPNNTTLSGNTQDMTPWVGTWFKLTMENKGYYAGNSRFSNDRQSAVMYLKITSWDQGNSVLQGNLYQQDAKTNQWLFGPLPLNYIAGSNVDFRVWAQVSGDFSYGFTAQIQGTEVGGVLESATVTTLGGYHLQTGSPEQVAGWLVLTGNLISESEVPVPAETVLN